MFNKISGDKLEEAINYMTPSEVASHPDMDKDNVREQITQVLTAFIDGIYCESRSDGGGGYWIEKVKAMSPSQAFETGVRLVQNAKAGNLGSEMRINLLDYMKNREAEIKKLLED